MTARKLQALRNLAERPGTPAEGELAREILARLEAKQSPPEDPLELLDAVIRDDFLAAWRQARWTAENLLGRP